MEKILTLSELLKKNKPVYIKNNSKPKGVIVLTFHEDNGKSIGFQVPPTFIPLCLSDVLPSDVIARSTSLRDSLYKKVLILVDPEEAEKELMSDQAMDELDALSTSVYSESSTGSALREQMEKTMRESQLLTNPEGGKLSSAQPTVEDLIDPKIKGVLLRLDSKEISAKDALANLRRMKDDMSMDDLSYVLKTTTDASINKFATEALAEKRNPKADTRVEIKPKTTAVAPTFKSEASFDLEDDGTPMTAEDRAREAQARAKQAINK